jgi:hypothetical protein
MPGEFVDLNAPSLQGDFPRKPEDLPHGLIPPPPRVLEEVAKERAKFPPAIFTPEAEERTLNNLTLQHYFDDLGHEVAYRSTPQGPEVLAVGFDEILTLTDGISPENHRTLKTWVP